MNKKLISTLAVVSLALVGCGTDDTTEQADTTAEVSTESSNGDRRSPEEIIGGIKENSGNGEERPSVGLDLAGGVQWGDGGYEAPLTDGSATVAGTVEGGERLFVIENGEVTEEVELEAGSFEYTTEREAGETIHLAADDRLEVGQTDVDMENIDRVEEIEFVQE